MYMYFLGEGKRDTSFFRSYVSQSLQLGTLDLIYIESPSSIAVNKYHIRDWMRHILRDLSARLRNLNIDKSHVPCWYVPHLIPAFVEAFCKGACLIAEYTAPRL